MKNIVKVWNCPGIRVSLARTSMNPTSKTSIEAKSSFKLTEQVCGPEKFYAGTRKGEINTLLVGEVHAKKKGGIS